MPADDIYTLLHGLCHLAASKVIDLSVLRFHATPYRIDARRQVVAYRDRCLYHVGSVEVTDVALRELHGRQQDGIVALRQVLVNVNPQRSNLAVGASERLVIQRTAEEADDAVYLLMYCQRVLVILRQTGGVQAGPDLTGAGLHGGEAFRQVQVKLEAADGHRVLHLQ